MKQMPPPPPEKCCIYLASKRDELFTRLVMYLQGVLGGGMGGRVTWRGFLICLLGAVFTDYILYFVAQLECIILGPTS